MRSRKRRVSFEKVFRDVATARATRSRGRDAFVARDFRSFFFRIDFGHGRAFWGSTSLSTCRSAHIHANVMCSSMSLLFVMEFIQGKIKSLEQIYLHSIPIKEYQIVDYFIGANLVDEVMKIMPVQKQTSAGQRMRFKAFVVVGDSNGHIGLGVKACKEVAHSIQGSMILAKLNMVPVRRIELPTPSLPMTCSTTELHRHM